MQYDNPFAVNIKIPLPTRRWLTPNESAAYLGVSRGTFDRAVRIGLVNPSRALGARTPRYGTHELDVLMGHIEIAPVEEEACIKTPYLTEKETGAYCRTTPKAMHDRAERGEVRAIKAVDGDAYLFLKEHLDEFLISRLTDNPA